MAETQSVIEAPVEQVDDREPWQARLDDIYEMMHEMSLQTDPQEMVRAYGRRVTHLFPSERRISLSRRELKRPEFRVTRYSEWTDEINPWKQKERLPLLRGGLFADLIYANKPVIIDEIDLAPGDPAAPYLKGQRSLTAIPMLDGGEALNMIISTSTEPAGFDKEKFPDTYWLTGLFGRATNNLVMKEQVQETYQDIDRELKVVSQIQKSLLPKQMPDIPGLDLSAYYETSARAGGDYYDFFPLKDGHWGIMIADVSGHGTPAAVVMAITHTIAHLYPGECHSPEKLLTFVNQQLCQRYTAEIEAFVTAFYAVYNPETKELRYASAGHNPPRIWHCSRQTIQSLDQSIGLPLGVAEDADYVSASMNLLSGDRLVLFTDGIIEAMNEDDQQFGPQRLDYVLNHSCRTGADDLRIGILKALDSHTRGLPAADDRTLVVATVE